MSKEEKVDTLEINIKKVINLSDSKTGFAIAFCIIFLTAGIFYASPYIDPDLWFHMKYGEYMVKNHTLIPDHTIYSWTNADPHWIYNTPFAQIFLYLLYQAGGLAALHIIHYFFLGAILFLFFIYPEFPKEKLNIFHLFAGLLVLVCIHLTASQMRPEIFSVLFIAVTAFVYFSAITAGKNFFYLYPVIFILWVNSHGVFIFGILFVSLAAFFELAAYFTGSKNRMDKKMLVHLVIFAILSYLSMLINPYGISWLSSIAVSFSSKEFLNQASELIAYQSVFSFPHPAKYILAAMVFSYACLIFYLWRKKIDINIQIVLINLAFMIISLKYARTAYYYPPIWYFSMVYMLHVLKGSHGIELLTPKVKTAIFAVLIIFSTGIIVKTLYYPLPYQPVGFGKSEYMPNGVADFLKKIKLEGPLYNNFYIGGFLMWELYPDYKIFIDTRHGPYKKYLFEENRAFEMGKNFEEFTTKYPFKLAVVQLQRNQLIDNFLKSQDWRLIYFDSSSALFAHKTVELPDIIVYIGADRFRNMKSYESLSYIMLMYNKIGDIKSARQIAEIMQSRFGHGMR